MPGKRHLFCCSMQVARTGIWPGCKDDSSNRKPFRQSSVNVASRRIHFLFLRIFLNVPPERLRIYSIYERLSIYSNESRFFLSFKYLCVFLVNKTRLSVRERPPKPVSICIFVPVKKVNSESASPFLVLNFHATTYPQTIGLPLHSLVNLHKIVECSFLRCSVASVITLVRSNANHGKRSS